MSYIFILFNMVYEFHVKIGDESGLDGIDPYIKILIMCRVIYESARKKHVNVVVAV